MIGRFGKSLSMQILATNPLLVRLRHSLRKAIPEAKSSHVAEALAASAGYKTSASLQAALNALVGRSAMYLDVDAAAFSIRLGTLSPSTIAGVPDVLIEKAAREAKAFVSGEGLDDLLMEMDEDPDDYVHDSGRRQFANIFENFERCVERGTDFVTQFEYVPEPGSQNLAGIMANVFAYHIEADVEFCAFLSEWFGLLSDRIDQITGLKKQRRDEATEDIEADLVWGTMIVATFAERVRDAGHMICQTWDDDHELETVPKRGPVLRSVTIARASSPRYPGAKVSATDGRREDFVTLADGRLDGISPGYLIGMSAFALWNAGASTDNLKHFAHEVQATRDTILHTCRRWCFLDDEKGDLQRRLYPYDPVTHYYGLTSEAPVRLVIERDMSAVNRMVGYLNHDGDGFPVVRLTLNKARLLKANVLSRGGTSEDIHVFDVTNAWDRVVKACQVGMYDDGCTVVLNCVDGVVPEPMFERYDDVFREGNLIVAVGLNEEGIESMRYEIPDGAAGIDATPDVAVVVTRPKLIRVYDL